MDEEFVAQIRRGLNLASKGQYRQLGRLSRLSSLTLVQNLMLSSPERSEVYIGDTIREMLWMHIDALKPTTPEDLNNPKWRIYKLARDHYIRGWGLPMLGDTMGLRESALEELKRLTGEAIASLIWKEEEQARIAAIPVDNLPPEGSIFDRYVERYNESGGKLILTERDETEQLAEAIIDDLRWKYRGVCLDGPPGVGKTSLAYEVARRCKERGLYQAIIWVSVKKRVLQLRTTSFALVPYLGAVVACDDVLDTIAHVLKNRAVSLPNGHTARRELVNDLLRDKNCLIIIDNLEDFDTEELDDLASFLFEYKGVSRVLLTSRPKLGIAARPITLPGMTYRETSKLIDMTCQRNGLLPLDETRRSTLHVASDGNPLAIVNILGLMATRGWSLDIAIQSYDKDATVEEYLWGPAYRLLYEMKPEVMQVLHTLPIFRTYSASIEAVAEATQLGRPLTSGALGVLNTLNFVGPAGLERYALRLSAYKYLKERQGVLTGDGELLAKAYKHLAQYYIKKLQGLGTVDARLALLAQGQGDEKWGVLRTLQGCCELAGLSGLYERYECCSPHEAREYVIKLFDFLGHSLGVLGYHDERLRWGQQACIACHLQGNQRKQLWFRVFDVGWTYLRFHDLDKAREIFTDALTEATEQGYEEIQALALYNMGRMARDNGEFDKASCLFTKSLDLWKRSDPSYAHWIAYAKSALGLTRYRQALALEGQDRRSRLLEARALLEESVQLRNAIGFTDEVSEGLSELALACAALDMMPDAYRHLDQAFDIARQIHLPNLPLAYAHWRAAEIQEIQGREKEAIDNYKAAKAIYLATGAQGTLEIIRGRLRNLGEDEDALN